MRKEMGNSADGPMIGHAQRLDPDDRLVLCQLQTPGDTPAGWKRQFVQNTVAARLAKRLEGFGETCPAAENIVGWSVVDESAYAMAALKQPPGNQVFDGTPYRMAVDAETFRQLVFRWQAFARREEGCDLLLERFCDLTIDRFVIISL